MEPDATTSTQEAAPVATPVQPTLTYQVGPQQLRQAMSNVGRLFFWIAGLSVLNTVLYLSHTNVMMLGGLGITLVVDVYGKILHQQSLAFTVDLMMGCIFVAFGLAAGRGSRTVFVVGMAVYALDALVLLYFNDIFNVAWHAYFLVNLNKSLQYSDRLRAALATLKARAALA